MYVYVHMNINMYECEGVIPQELFTLFLKQSVSSQAEWDLGPSNQARPSDPQAPGNLSLNLTKTGIIRALYCGQVFPWMMSIKLKSLLMYT